MSDATEQGTNIRAIVFDFGGVLITSITHQLHKIAVQHGVDVATMLSILLGPHESGSHPWHQAERGEIAVSAIQEGLQPWATAHGVSLVGDEIEALMAPGQYTVITPMLDKVSDLRKRGYATGLLTNSFAEFRPTMQRDLRFEDFSAVVESFAIGARKPEQAIYEATAQMLQVQHSEILYLDDFHQNIAMAQTFSWTTIEVGDPLVALAEIDSFLPD